MFKSSIQNSKDDDSSTAVNCVDQMFRSQGKGKWKEEEGNRAGGVEKANIHPMSCMSRCCDIHFTYVTSNVLGIIVTVPAETSLGLWAQTQTG